MRAATPGTAAASCAAVLATVLVACDGADKTADEPPAATGPTASPTPSPSSPSASPSTSPTATPPSRSPAPPPLASAAQVRPQLALDTVRHLAEVIGPRHGTSPAFERAAQWVSSRLQTLGYAVRRQPFDVPGGTSWGVPVDAGRSMNLVATQGTVDLARPHLVVGAHLDTVPQAPGAEDNASGVGALLAVAEALAGRRTRLPVVLVAFGAEEPRGPSDDDHHYGSQHYVGRMSPAERAAVRGMVSLDRVGVGTVMPVCSATADGGALRAEVLDAAARAGVTAVEPCTGNRASDHWSFVRNGLPGVRLGSTPFAGYHSEGDVTSVVDAAQLGRAARITVA